MDVVLGPESQPLTMNTIMNGVPYWYSVAWIPGCVTDADSENAYQPVKGDADDTCYSMLRANFLNCE